MNTQEYIYSWCGFFVYRTCTDMFSAYKNTASKEVTYGMEHIFYARRRMRIYFAAPLLSSSSVSWNIFFCFGAPVLVLPLPPDIIVASTPRESWWFVFAVDVLTLRKLSSRVSPLLFPRTHMYTFVYIIFGLCHVIFSNVFFCFVCCCLCVSIYLY